MGREEVCLLIVIVGLLTMTDSSTFAFCVLGFVETFQFSLAVFRAEMQYILPLIQPRFRIENTRNRTVVSGLTTVTSFWIKIPLPFLPHSSSWSLLSTSGNAPPCASTYMACSLSSETHWCARVSVAPESLGR